MTKSNGQRCARILNPAQELFPPIHTHHPIEWPTQEQIMEVAKRLSAIRQRGAGFEAAGDYFNSGDLAYELREIIQATAELFRRSQRSNVPGTSAVSRSA